MNKKVHCPHASIRLYIYIYIYIHICMCSASGVHGRSNYSHVVRDLDVDDPGTPGSFPYIHTFIYIYIYIYVCVCIYIQSEAYTYIRTLIHVLILICM